MRERVQSGTQAHDFKMKEAHRLHEQFSRDRGWTEQKRDARVMTFASIIRNMSVCIHACMRNDDFTRYVKSLPVPERKLGTDNPYWMIFMRLALSLAMKTSRNWYPSAL